ncbi:MAG: hypothetical protein SGILL_002045 [Bacillariaceae sp.]
MLADQRHEGNSPANAFDDDNSDADAFPVKRKTSVLQKTRQALENFKNNHNSNKAPPEANMILIESDSSFNFNPDDDDFDNNDDDDNVVKPFSERIFSKSTLDKEEEDSGTKATEAEMKELDDYEEEEDEMELNDAMPSSFRKSEAFMSPRTSNSRGSSSRNLMRNSSRPRKSGNPPKKAVSCGDISRTPRSSRPSSARFKRHGGSAQSPGPLASAPHLVTPTHLSKDTISSGSSGSKDLPEPPQLTTPSARGEKLQATPETPETTEDSGAMGGYFSKLVEKMEGDEVPPESTSSEANDGVVENEDGKKGSSLFKTPIGIKKLFSLNRASTPRETSNPSKQNSNNDEKVNDLAMFTAFISSPKPVDPVRKSDSSRAKRNVQEGDEDDEIETEMDFPEIPLEKQTRLDDIRKEVCGKREISAPDSRKHSVSPGRLARKVKGESSDAPSSPSTSSRRHRRSKIEDRASSKAPDDSIPRHSSSRRNQRSIRMSESGAYEKSPGSRSSHNRSRRSRGSSSRATSDLESSRKESAAHASEGDEVVFLTPVEDVHTAEEDEEEHKRPSSRRLLRSTRGSSRRLVTNPTKPSSEKRLDLNPTKPSSEKGLNSQSARRKRASGSRRQDRPASRRSSGDGRSRPKESGGRQLGRSTSFSKLQNKSDTDKGGRKPRSLRAGSSHGATNLSSLYEMDSSDTEEDEIDDDGFACIQEEGEEEEEAPLAREPKKGPSLAASLERGSDLNRHLCNHGSQETVVTDDGSLWLDQGSVSGMNIRSSGSVAAPQLSFDQTMTKIVDRV